MQYHHERYDGKGYPKGLSKNQIPELARIMIVADAFDAMTTNRIYKSRKSIKEAIKEIGELSGKQFDPDVAKVAIEVFANLDNIALVSQLPVTQLEQERFSYFFRDQLTSTYNRDYLDFMLSQNHLHKTYNFITIIYLHNFGNYNKEFGWSKGDQLLHDFATELNIMIKESLIFRIHGDDFLVLSQNMLDIDKKAINNISFLKDNGLFCSVQVISLKSNNISELISLESYLDEN